MLCGQPEVTLELGVEGHWKGQGHSGLGTLLRSGKRRLGSDLRPPQLSVPQSPSGAEARCTLMSPSPGLLGHKAPGSAHAAFV